MKEMNEELTMIIVMKTNAPQSSIDNVVRIIEAKGLEAHLSRGKEVAIIGVVGDKSKLQTENLEIAPDVDKIVPVTESYKLSNKKFHPEPSIIKVGNTQIGGDTLTIMAGPCAVETEKQLLSIAHAVKAAGATIVRGGAFKPRNSPYPFQGLGEKEYAICKKPEKRMVLQTFVK